MRQRIVIFVTGSITAMALAAFGVWLWHRSATPMPGWTAYSPDARFRIEYCQVWTFRHLLPTAPGNGSDNIDGFIRLYRADGTLLHETFRSMLSSYQAFWDGDSVYFLGDGPVWTLPN